MKITKKQIKEAYNDVSKLKEWYPDAFEEKLSKDYTGWVKSNQVKDKKWIMYFEDGIQKYGIDSLGDWWSKNIPITINIYDVKATDKEIKTALVNEAKKRGFKKGVIINDIYCGKNEKSTTIISSNNFDYEPVLAGVNAGKMALRDSDGNILFIDDIWATIIKPKQMTKEEIETELGYKIEIV